MQQGDLCLSATGEKIAFLSRENLSEKQRVYNFEVEEKHAYFVGVKNMLLTHNQCGPGTPEGQNVIMPDGSIRFIPDTIDPNIPLPSYVKRSETNVIIIPPIIKADEHVALRKILNKDYLFDDLPENLRIELSTPSLYNERVIGGDYRTWRMFQGERWSLSPPDEAIFHSPARTDLTVTNGFPKVIENLFFVLIIRLKQIHGI